jgi:hypothetical protein
MRGNVNFISVRALSEVEKVKAISAVSINSKAK